MATSHSAGPERKGLGALIAEVLAVARWAPGGARHRALVLAPRAGGYVLFEEDDERTRQPPILTRKLSAGDPIGFDSAGGACAVAGAERHPLPPGRYAWHHDEATRQRAAAEAIGHLRVLAAVIAGGSGLARADAEFLDHLCQTFWLRLLAADRRGQIDCSDPGHLAGFANTTMGRLFIDEYRNWRRRPGQAEQSADLSAVPSAAQMTRLSAFLGSAESLPEDDLRVIETWPVRDRLMLLCWIGLWRRSPEDRWTEWVRLQGLGFPFPPSEFERAPEGRRTLILAAALGMKPNTLSANLMRKLPRLGELPSLRWLLGLDED